MLSLKLQNKYIYVATALFLITAITVATINFLSLKNEQKPSASWVDSYTNTKDLTDKADLIVIGKVVASVPERRFDIIVTMQIIKIEKYVKGEKVADDIVKVAQTGGELNGYKSSEFSEAPLFKKNDKYVLFLGKTPEGHYLVLGGFQGLGKIVNGKVSVNVDEDEIGKVFKNKRIEEVETIINKNMGK
jgi:hypothetical protein